MTYSLSGISIESEVPLAGVASGCRDDAACTVAIRKPRSQPGVEWFLDLPPTGGSWLRAGALGRDYQISFRTLADFFLDSSCRDISCCPHFSTPVTTISHLLRSQVLPMALAQQGHHFIHAAAVAGSRGATDFLGPSKYGKSTLVAYLGLSGQEIVSEDVLRIAVSENQVIGSPECPEFRLWTDSLEALFPGRPPRSEAVAHYTRKQRVVLGSVNSISLASSTVPITSVVLLQPTSGERPTSLRRLGASEGFQLAASAMFRLDVRNRDRARQEFQFLTALVENAPFYALEFPRSFARLAEVHEKLRTTVL